MSFLKKLVSINHIFMGRSLKLEVKHTCEIKRLFNINTYNIINVGNWDHINTKSTYLSRLKWLLTIGRQDSSIDNGEIPPSNDFKIHIYTRKIKT